MEAITNKEQPFTLDFSRIIGQDEVKMYLLECLNAFINHPDEWKEYLKATGSRSALVLLLNGEPGIGKTMFLEDLYHTLKGHAGIYVDSIKASDMQKTVGSNAKAIEEYFNELRSVPQPTVIALIDEIDVLMLRKGQHLNTQERTTAFQAELDGMNDSSKIIVVGSTNHVYNLEPAAVSRCTQIDLQLPSDDDRIEFVKRYICCFDMDEPIDIQAFADYTVGFTGRNYATSSKNLKLRQMMKHKLTVVDILQELKRYARVAYKRSAPVKDAEQTRLNIKGE